MLPVAVGYGRVEFIGVLPPSKRTIDTALDQAALPLIRLLCSMACFLSVVHTTAGFCMCLLLHSSRSHLTQDVPSVMLPKNVMAITLASLRSSPSPLLGIIRKPFTLTLRCLSTGNCLHYTIRIALSFTYFVSFHTFSELSEVK